MMQQHSIPKLLLLLVVASTWTSLSLLFLCSHGQPDSLGFISIDCGYTDSPYYQDSSGLTWKADKGFTDAGLIHPVGTENLQRNKDLPRSYANVRYFPNGRRSCYTLTLRSQPTGNGNGTVKYYLRASFGYGNYDGLDLLPVFDLYLGPNYWTTVRIVNASTAYFHETIAAVPAAAGFLQVCLVNLQQGNPFISALDLRPLRPDLYPDSNATHSLVSLSYFRDTVAFGPNRYHFGTHEHFRFPDDQYDRLWQRYQNVSSWTVPQDPGSGVFKNPPNDTYDAPTAVMLSASTPLNASATMDLAWSSDASMEIDADTVFLLLLYFAELDADVRAGKASRQFDVLLDNVTLAPAFSPLYMMTTVITGRAQGPGPHTISLVPTLSSQLPPLISAMEIYLHRPQNESATRPADGLQQPEDQEMLKRGAEELKKAALNFHPAEADPADQGAVLLTTAAMTIKSKYSVTRNWQGDPCSPTAFAWNGLNCSYTGDGLQRIIALNLSSSGLTGEIDSSFGQLAKLKQLDLSHNNLSGPIPDILGQVPPLTFIDLSYNNLNGSIPTTLWQKSQANVLILRVDHNPNLCLSLTCRPPPNGKRHKEILIDVVAGLAVGTILIVTLVLLAIWHTKRKRQGATRATNPFENRRFKYKELKVITDDFRNIIGKGGFGLVYFGKLQGGIPVAVKMRSESSKQGNAEFLAEARHLARVHHKNLVSLIGYCKDRKHLGFVYEFMDGGNLEHRLRGGDISHGETPLTWLQRLKIALESAYGLEYLHRSCRPPLIHRDVKTQNILLTSNLEAKLSDFGLTRAFSNETKTHTSTQPAGTIGYLDPEYYTTSHLSAKSDVYSFGIVLLALITGQSAIIDDNDGKKVNIANWVHERLSEGDVVRLTDSRIRGDCDTDSVRKVVDLALKCTENVGRDRPTMSEVVGLMEGLQMASCSMQSSSTETSDDSGIVADVQTAFVLEIEEAFR